MLPILNEQQLEIFTEGDREEERILLDLFLEQAALRITELQAVLTGGESVADRWRAVAHQLKGSAANLGAEALSAACKDAEINPQVSAEEKQRYLSAIQMEIAALQSYRNERHSH